MHATLPLLKQTDFPDIYRSELTTLQINLGYLCNLSCVHCHVNAGPNRKELMRQNTIDEIFNYIDKTAIKTLDLTGGAPEMNPYFKYLIEQAQQRKLRVIDRCNLVILQEPGYAWLAEYLAENKVEVIASLPCYLEENVDQQRGKGVFNQSIAGLQKLNALGYGKDDQNLQLNLVFNPQGASLPPNQQQLQKAYKEHLWQHFKVHFNQLFVLTNMPIQRFGSTLISKGTFRDYMNLLKDNFQADNLPTVMCRNTLSIDWQGYIYDCDFNQMLRLNPTWSGAKKKHISELLNITLTEYKIRVAEHCYGCTAGQGSSCGGALS